MNATPTFAKSANCARVHSSDDAAMVMTAAVSCSIWLSSITSSAAHFATSSGVQEVQTLLPERSVYSNTNERTLLLDLPVVRTANALFGQILKWVARTGLPTTADVSEIQHRDFSTVCLPPNLLARHFLFSIPQCAKPKAEPTPHTSFDLTI